MPSEHTVTGLRFEIVQGDGTMPEPLVVDSDRVLIGSAAHCEIRLTDDQVAAEHVLITFTGGNVFARARALRPPPLLNGSAFTEAPLHPGAVLTVGRAEITVSLIEIAERANVIHKKQQSISPLTYALALVVIPLSLYVLLNERRADETGRAPTEVPPLWDAQIPPCPQSAADQARAVARDKKVIAEGKRERSPFDIRDGVAAVPLFATAAACFHSAGESENAARMEQASEVLRAAMEEAYRAHRMRLEHALDVKQERMAQREVRILLDMLQDRTGPYMVWLSNLDRRLKIKLGKEKKP